MSTDDEEAVEKVRTVYMQKKKKINKKNNIDDGATEKQKLEATMDYLADRDLKKAWKAGKNSHLAVAEVEEIEDKLVEAKERKGVTFSNNDF